MNHVSHVPFRFRSRSTFIDFRTKCLQLTLNHITFTYIDSSWWIPWLSHATFRNNHQVALFLCYVLCVEYSSVQYGYCSYPHQIKILSLGWIKNWWNPWPMMFEEVHQSGQNVLSIRVKRSKALRTFHNINIKMLNCWLRLYHNERISFFHLIITSGWKMKRFHLRRLRVTRTNWCQANEFCIALISNQNTGKLHVRCFVSISNKDIRKGEIRNEVARRHRLVCLYIIIITAPA